MLEEYLDFAVRMAEEAGRIQLAYFRGDDLAMKTKSNVSDVVTRADRESEELIVRRIAERYPTHAVLGEEGGARGDAAGEWRWVVDPLDGTTNYSQGLPVFCVSIALQHRGETVVGVVYAPTCANSSRLYGAEVPGADAERVSPFGCRYRPSRSSRVRSSRRDSPTTRARIPTTTATTWPASSPACAMCAGWVPQPTTWPVWRRRCLTDSGS